MNASEYRPQIKSDNNIASNNTFGINSSYHSLPEKKSIFRRERILEKDRKKRYYIILSFASIISLALMMAFALSFKPSILKDSYLVDNIEILSSNEGLEFYKEFEFYQWLDLAATEEKSVDSM